MRVEPINYSVEGHVQRERAAAWENLFDDELLIVVRTLSMCVCVCWREREVLEKNYGGGSDSSRRASEPSCRIILTPGKL